MKECVKLILLFNYWQYIIDFTDESCLIFIKNNNIKNNKFAMNKDQNLMDAIIGDKNGPFIPDSCS